MYTRGIKSRQPNGSFKGDRMADSNRQWHSYAGGDFLSLIQAKGGGVPWHSELAVVTDVGAVDSKASRSPTQRSRLTKPAEEKQERQRGQKRRKRKTTTTQRNLGFARLQESCVRGRKVWSEINKKDAWPGALESWSPGPGPGYGLWTRQPGKVMPRRGICHFPARHACCAACASVAASVSAPGASLDRHPVSSVGTAHTCTLVMVLHLELSALCRCSAQWRVWQQGIRYLGAQAPQGQRAATLSLAVQRSRRSISEHGCSFGLDAHVP